MPVLNLPAFRARTPFVCPIDNVNPNRVFPGDPHGSYSEQMTHACINEFVVHADAYVDLHGGDIPEALVPFVICRGVTTKLLRNRKQSRWRSVCRTCSRSASRFNRAKGTRSGLSSYAAAADKGIPAILAEAGGVGQMQEEAIELLVDGIVNVMRHLGMIDDANFKFQIKNRNRRRTRRHAAPWLQNAADTAALQF